LKIHDELYELAERYLSGQLEGEELRRAENLRETSEDFQQHLLWIQKANRVIKAESLAIDFDTILIGEKKYFRKQKIKKISTWSAAAVILAGIIFLIMDGDLKLKNDHEQQKEPEVEKTDSEKEIQANYSDSNSFKPVNRFPTQVQVSQLVPTNRYTSDSLVNPFQNSPDPTKTIADTFVQIQAVNNNDPPIPSLLPCSKEPNIEVKASNCCKNQQDGKIEIRIPEENIHSYQFSLNNKQFSHETTFPFLSEGSYEIFIKDAKGCTYSRHLTIEEKECMSSKGTHILFSNSKSYHWEFPLIDEQEQTLTIFNNNGQVMLELPIRQGEPSSWNGRDVNGNPLAMGLYPFKISVSGEVKLSGTITVVE
jgi:hypothetical protein